MRTGDPVAMTPVPAPYICCCWNMHFLSNLRDPGFFLSGREDGRAGGTHHKKKRECGLYVEGLQGREGKGCGLRYGCLRARDGRWLLPSFFFFKPWNRKKVKAPNILKLKLLSFKGQV